ncbi:MAG TPA: efflux RND transporter periplasmic adaptor subunit [Pyrinomonadaceae bacterium]
MSDERGASSTEMSRDKDSPDVHQEPARDDAPLEDADKVVVVAESIVLDNAAEAKRRRQRNIVVGIAALVLLTLVAYLLLRPSNKTADAASAEEVVVSVRVAKAERQPIAAEVAALGTIFPREQATVAAKVGAQIKQMRLLKNVIVRAGEVIAVLETRDLQAQRAEAVAALQEARLNVRGLSSGAIPQANAQAEKDLRDARANVNVARAQYERRRDLYSKGGIAFKEVEAAQLALTTAEDNLRLAERTSQIRTNAINPNDRALAESRVSQAEQRVATIDAQLSYAVVRAPLTGVVTDQFQFEGEYATPGGRLVQIADISEVVVKAQFADSVVAQLKVGDPATVSPTDLSGEQMSGKVSLISRSSDALNRSVEVWVNLGNGGGQLRTGGAAQVKVATNQSGDAVVVPASAVTLDASNAETGTVMVVGLDSVAHETKVTVGIRAPQQTQITSGLTGGETVVIEGNYALPDGTKVEVAEADAGGSDAGKEEKP